MTTASPPSARQRVLELRMRPDLAVRRLDVGGRGCWGVKDPVSLRYFHLRDEEYFILGLLDGRASAEEIRSKFERRFAPKKLDLQQLHNFLGVLYRQGLAAADTEGRGEELLRRRREERRRSLLAAVGNVLAIRFRGVDPERFLNWLHPKCRWIFSPACFAAWLLLALSAIALVAVQFDVLQARLPDAQAFFHVRNAVWLAVAMAAAKVLHELGHGLACKHFGGECHELGLMLLVFTPCLYCNVSDSWMLNSKWRRAAIGAAGMVVEVALASFCTLIWWFSEPGLLNSLCLNIMFVCSVSTLVFNANPLLRFDGYFILSDLTETPNLQQRSSAVALSWLRKTVLGMERDGGRVVREQRPGLLALYAVASASYRCFVVVGILWFCHRALKTQGLETVAHVLTLAVVAGLVGPLVWRTVVFLRDPRTSRQVKGRRLFGWAVFAAMAAALACLTPLPHRISAPLVLQPRGARPVYVTAPGSLEQSVREGQVVRRGQVLARLENLDVRREAARLEGLRDLQAMRLENLKRRQVGDPRAGEQIPVAEEAMADIQQRLEKRRADYERLTIVSPADGVILPPPRTPEDESGLRGWAGSPLDPRNQGAFLETGVLLGWVGDPRCFDAVLVIDQADVEFVQVGRPVRIQIDQMPGQLLAGVVSELSRVDLKTAPRELTAAGLLPAREDSDGQRRPVHASYLARVRLDDLDQPLVLGSPGRAKIESSPQSLGSRIHRYLRRTFRFEF